MTRKIIPTLHCSPRARASTQALEGARLPGQCNLTWLQASVEFSESEREDDTAKAQLEQILHRRLSESSRSKNGDYLELAIISSDSESEASTCQRASKSSRSASSYYVESNSDSDSPESASA